MAPMDQSAWERTGRLLAGRRVQINARYKNRRVFATERGVNWRTLHDVEHAKRTNFKPETLQAFETAYMLVPGSFARTLAGGELEPAATGKSPAHAEALHPVPPPPGPARDTGEMPVISADPGEMASYVDTVWGEVGRAKAAHGPRPGGAQVFPGDVHEARMWNREVLSEAERVRLIAYIRLVDAKATGSNGHGQRAS